MKKYTVAAIWLGSLLLIAITGCETTAWQSLFNGKELPPYPHYLGRPDASIDIPGLQRDSLGNYLEALGTEDPLGVYSVDTLGGEPVIRISGQVIGGLVLHDSLSNYHLRLKFKWGDYKWDWMEGRPKDGGILYHQGNGVRHELQIHEGDVGSYWAKKVALDIPARYTADIPKAIQTAKPYLKDLVNTLYDTMLIYDSNAPLHHFDGSGGFKDWQIVIANPYNENPHGEWNTLELICYENHAVHIVNEKANLILLNSSYMRNGKRVPLNSGRLVLQSEGAVLYFKEIEMKRINEIPSQIASYVKQ
ncbi:MAG: hypothetical protein CL946_03765 [Ectothiorhodospiraceae bacterium]|nr:hypothetical protein [Ectothiorhodospiraceae bacterium]